MRSVKWKVRPISYYDPLSGSVDIRLFLHMTMHKLPQVQDIAVSLADDIRGVKL